MSSPQRTIDVSHLPTHAFGKRDAMWWGTLGFVVIEGVTFAICIATYFYLRPNFETWPPQRTPSPDLWPMIANVLLMLASIIPVRWTQKRAFEENRRATRNGLVVCCLFGVGILVLRVFELQALNTRWDEHAYGSIVWATVGLHTVQLVTDVLDTFVLTALFFSRRFEKKLFPGADDNAIYWYFIVGSWFVLAAMIWLTPRLT